MPKIKIQKNKNPKKSLSKPSQTSINAEINAIKNKEVLSLTNKSKSFVISELFITSITIFVLGSSFIIMLALLFLLDWPKFYLSLTFFTLAVGLNIYYILLKYYRYNSYLKLDNKGVILEYLSFFLRPKKIVLKWREIDDFVGEIRTNYILKIKLKKGKPVPIPYEIWQNPENLNRLRLFLVSVNQNSKIESIWFAVYQAFVRKVFFAFCFIVLIYTLYSVITLQT